MAVEVSIHICPHTFRGTILFQASLTGSTVFAIVDHATHSDEVPDFEFGHFGPHFCDNSQDFMLVNIPNNKQSSRSSSEISMLVSIWRVNFSWSYLCIVSSLRLDANQTHHSRVTFNTFDKKERINCLRKTFTMAIFQSNFSNSRNEDLDESLSNRMYHDVGQFEWMATKYNMFEARVSSL